MVITNLLFFKNNSLLQDLVNLLKPFFDATELLSGSKYTTLNFVYPTIYFLMEKFSISNKSDDELFDLIYSSEQEEENTPGNLIIYKIFYL